MNKGTVGFVKGMAVGVSTAAALGAIGTQMLGKNKKKMKKNAGRAIRAVGDFMENVQYMIK